MSSRQRYWHYTCTIELMKQPDDPTAESLAPKHAGKRPSPASAGQSGDDMGLSHEDAAGSESVAELVDEGQYFEAEAVSGIARPYPDEDEVHTHEVPADDVPMEYPAKDSSLDTD